MRRLFIKNATRNFFFWTYLATLFLSFHYFLITYINSTVLGQYVTDKNLGVIYTLGSILTIFIFLNVARILKKWGNYRAMLVFLAIESVALLAMACFNDVKIVVAAFIIHHAVYPLIVVSLDVFLEHYSKNETTGKIRGIFLTVMNSTAVISPLIIGYLIGQMGYPIAYFLSVMFSIALFLLVRSKFRNYRDNELQLTKGVDVLIEFLHTKSIRQIFVTSLMLQIFYSWMIVYVPIYLYKYLHFSWEQIGLALAISLLPFIIFEIPLGELADQKIGEKEILLVGFIIMIGAVVVMGQASSPILPLWIILMTLARTGASFVEVASDTYFFKHIDKTNNELIGLWRISNPLGYILGTIAGSVSLIVLPFQYIFYVLAAILVIGLIYAAKIKDTL